MDFWAVLDKDKFVGFVYLINDKKATFVLYLAVDERQHSKGYGSQILALIEHKKAGKTIVLDIETADNTEADNHAQRVKCQAFYVKNGFEHMDFRLQDNDDYLDVLCKNGRIDEKGYLSCLSYQARVWAGEYSDNQAANYLIITVNSNSFS